MVLNTQFSKRDIIGQDVVEGRGETINFSEVKDVEFQFTLDAAPQLPSNRLRIAQAATEILEAQAQYGMQVELITPEGMVSIPRLPTERINISTYASR